MKTASDVTILFVDDEPDLLSSLRRFLYKEPYHKLFVGSGNEALEILAERPVDIVVSDLHMPEMDGLTLLGKVKSGFPGVIRLILSATKDVEQTIDAINTGEVYRFITKPLDPEPFKQVIRDTVDYHPLKTERQKMNRQIDMSRRKLIGILSQAAEYRDFETGKHFRRVSEISGLIAREMGWSEDMVNIIELASPVHDIGKIGVPDNILRKNGQLDNSEWAIMKKHCQYGGSILMAEAIPESFIFKSFEKTIPDSPDLFCSMLEMAVKIALNHHEHWDGSGYPLGLQGEEIPVEARITAVADVFDALNSKRPYKEPWPEKKCLNFIREQAGKQFDPEIVRVFFVNIDIISEINKRWQD